MGVELIRKAMCDRCGKECYHLVENIISENAGKRKFRVTDNIYSYTEVALKCYDSRFETAEPLKIILCGSCIDELGKWITEKPQKEEQNGRMDKGQREVARSKW